MAWICNAISSSSGSSRRMHTEWVEQCKAKCAPWCLCICTAHILALVNQYFLNIYTNTLYSPYKSFVKKCFFLGDETEGIGRQPKKRKKKKKQKRNISHSSPTLRHDTRYTYKCIRQMAKAFEAVYFSFAMHFIFQSGTVRARLYEWTRMKKSPKTHIDTH